MTVTIEIPDELAVDLAYLPREAIHKFANNYAVAGLRRVAAASASDPNEFEEACAAITESQAQFARGQHMTLSEAKARYTRERKEESAPPRVS